MFALITFSAFKVSSIELASDVNVLKAIVEKKEDESVEWVQDGPGLQASAPSTPLISYRIQPAAVR